MRTQEQREATRVNGMRHYNESIKPTLTDADDGLFFAIDTKTGEYEKGTDELDVAERLANRMPDAEIFMLVHPRIWVHSILTPFLTSDTKWSPHFSPFNAAKSTPKP